MTIRLNDTIKIHGVRITDSGYLVGTARVARVGIQTYLGSEVGRDDMPIVRVFRPPEEVFARDSMASYAGKPMTDDHPAEDVTADNWASLAIGNLGTNVMRDGEFVRVDLSMMDRAAVKRYQDGKAELSAGYSAELVFEAGIHDGQPYDAWVKNLRINHVAQVDRARGGEKLRLGDRHPEPQDTPSSNPETKETSNMKTILIDGATIQIDDAGIGLLHSMQKRLADAAAATAAAVSEAVALKDTEIGRLTAELATAKAAVLSDSEIAVKAAAHAELVSKARALHDADYTGKGAEEIRSIVVHAKLGDSGKGLTPEGIAGAFAVLSANVVADPLRRGLLDAKPADNGTGTGLVNSPNSPTGAITTAQDAYQKRLADAWRGEKPAA